MEYSLEELEQKIAFYENEVERDQKQLSLLKSEYDRRTNGIKIDLNYIESFKK